MSEAVNVEETSEKFIDQIPSFMNAIAVGNTYIIPQVRVFTLNGHYQDTVHIIPSLDRRLKERLELSLTFQSKVEKEQTPNSLFKKSDLLSAEDIFNTVVQQAVRSGVFEAQVENGNGGVDVFFAVSNTAMQNHLRAN